MSTRSYVGIIKNGKVTYGYHHSDSHLESLGIDLFRNIRTEEEANAKIDKYISHYDDEEEMYQDTIGNYFKIPEDDIVIEFCYGFDTEENCWYVSSCHFTDASKVFKLTEVVQDDDEMEAYLDMYYEDCREGILNEIRNGIEGKEPKEYTFEFSTSISVDANDEEEAIEKAWSDFGAALAEHGMSLFYMYDEYGKEV